MSRLIVATLLILCGVLHFSKDASALDEDDFTMEIQIDSPDSISGLVTKFVEDDTIVAKVGQKDDCHTGRPCQNDGVCTSTASTVMVDPRTSAQCLCKLGFTGPRCEERMSQPKFPEIRDGGYLAFGEWFLPRTGDFEIQIQVQPKVLRPKTLLAFHASSTRARAFHLVANDGIVQLTVYNKSQNGGYHRSLILHHPMYLIGGESRVVVISFGLQSSGDLFLSVDGQEIIGHLKSQPISGPTYHNHNDITDDVMMKHAIYIGGHPSLSDPDNSPIPGTAENSLLGCLGDIRLNKHLVDPRQLAFVGDAIDGFGVSDCAANLCEERSCEGGAGCRTLSLQQFICLCPLDTEPPRCKQGKAPVMPEFVGNSYIAVRGLKDTSLTETLVEIMFMAKSPTGLLLYSGFSSDRRGDFVAVTLVDGQAVVTFDLGTGPASRQSSLNVTLDKWHRLAVKRSGRSFEVSLDGEKAVSTAEAYGFNPGPFVQLTITDHLFIGGHPDADGISALLPHSSRLVSYKEVVGFSGCVQLVRVNGIRVDLVKEATTAVNIGNCNGHACARQTTPCGFHGYCEARAESWRCFCDPGYAGKRCQRVKFTRAGRVFYVVVETIGKDLNLRLYTWNLPSHWPLKQPISSIIDNHQANTSVSRQGRSLTVVVEGKTATQLDLNAITMNDFSPAEIYIGGAPMQELDKIKFLDEFGSGEETLVGPEITGFRGCISDMWINDARITLVNATRAQNIDSCSDV